MSDLLMNDYTPGPIVLQGAEAVKELLLLDDPENILDPSAGAGVFGQVFRQVWPKAYTTAIEPKKSELYYLSCNYDQHTINTFEDTLVFLGFDLVMTNPPFHSWVDFVWKGLAIVKPGGYVVLLGLTSWGSRSKEGSELFEQVPPRAQLRITGAVGFRGDGKNDARDYCWWVFQKEKEGLIHFASWASINLPRLTSDGRKWKGRKPGRTYGEKFQTSTDGHSLSTFGGRTLPRRVLV